MSQFSSSQHLQEFCTKSLKQYLRETLELEPVKESEKKINITVNNICEDNKHCQDTSSSSSSSSSRSSYSEKETETERKPRTIPHFIQWQAPIVEWLNPLREWQAPLIEYQENLLDWYVPYGADPGDGDGPADEEIFQP